MEKAKVRKAISKYLVISIFLTLFIGIGTGYAQETKERIYVTNFGGEGVSVIDREKNIKISISLQGKNRMVWLYLQTGNTSM